MTDQIADKLRDEVKSLKAALATKEEVKQDLARRLLEVSGNPRDGLAKTETNPCDQIAISCGWNPLNQGEKMTVSFECKEYTIERTK